MKLNSKAFGNALAVAAAVLYALCAVLAVALPGLLLGIYGPWFHRMDVSRMWMNTAPGLGSILWGMVTMTAVSWIFGYALAEIYNKFLKGK
ncbi:MAG: hypothetical protein UV19_C0025G0002 [Parcubacteria group bacterium GW2011_GWA2_42_28]|nr:MAG: hypothetical protein UV19_C0025G0002 [Parcubacteria group bacterium GW2011_GWA2_42_28]